MSIQIPSIERTELWWSHGPAIVQWFTGEKWWFSTATVVTRGSERKQSNRCGRQPTQRGRVSKHQRRIATLVLVRSTLEFLNLAVKKRVPLCYNYAIYGNPKKGWRLLMMLLLNYMDPIHCQGQWLPWTRHGPPLLCLERPAKQKREHRSSIEKSITSSGTFIYFSRALYTYST